MKVPLHHTRVETLAMLFMIKQRRESGKNTEKQVLTGNFT